MKVTVCFGPIRVVVPCGHGEILVRDLMRQATLRYRKATGKSASSWLAVHSLQSQAGGGILDPDDRVLDVADDREQIIANFEDADARHVPGGPPHPHHHIGAGERGDGASGGGSSVGSSSAGGNSPELFLPHPHLHAPFVQTDIDVTGEQIAAAGLTPLQVRRGSEPALNHLAPGPPQASSSPGGHPAAPDPTKRWSAAPLIEDEPQLTSAVARKAQHRKENSRQRGTSENGHLSPTWGEEDEGGGETGRSNGSAFSRFVRDSNRLSMQFLGEGANGVRWVEAAERAAAIDGPCAPRKEPLGANSSSPVQQTARVLESDVEDEDILEFVVLRNEEGPLGIHVVPDYDRLGQDRGLLVQGIEPGGRIDQDGRLAFCDRIIEINGHNLLNLPFQTVQEIFRDSLRSPELRLQVVKARGSAGQTRRPPAPVFPRMHQSGLSPHRAPSEDRDNVAMVEGEEKVPSVNTKVATVSPTKKVPVHPASRNANILLTANTRKMGKKLEIELLKGPHGLGFSITTRDNPAGGNCPIYIKNILPKGAAVEDGRLRPGDRLLEVNNVAMTGKTQSEAVSILRNAPAGGKVLLVVSRQEKGDESPRLPRELTPARSDTGPEDLQTHVAGQSEPPEKANDDGLIFPWKHREVVTFDIPVHDTEKAGLGVSVKGKTTAAPNGTIDLGIFVKSVINGGAASRDGRLRTNDQLVDINGVSLLGTSNSDAMETLRRGMHQEGPKPGVITLTVARRVPSTPGSNNADTSFNSLDGTTSGRDSANSLLSSSSGTETFGVRLDGEGPTPENSCASETSDNTVIFLPKINGDAPRPPDYIRPPPDRRMMNPLDPLATRNPVLDRLTGQQQQYQGLRNESYYRATNDSWNASFASKFDKYGSPTIHCPTGETVLIQDEYSPHPIIAPHPRRPERIHIVQTNRNDQPPDGEAGHPMTPQSQSSQDPSTPRLPNADITYASQTSLEEVDAAGFSRDAFGRQSMSEKRHAALDAKNTDTYQRNKKLREERERQRHMQTEQQNMNDRRREELMNGHGDLHEARHREPGAMYRASSAESIISITRSQAGSELESRKIELGPGLGMKKSSSLESLQTMVQEMQMQEDGEVAYTYRGSQGPVKVIRGRGCNESFRAAVDRSYDAPLADIRTRMETLSEEEAEVANVATFGRGTRQQSSLNSALDSKYGKKDAKKKAGLFRGIGSMFRFGKHRKGVENPLQSGKVLTEEEPEEVQQDAQLREQERQAARQAAQDEQQRIHEQYQRLMQRQRQTENQQVLQVHGHPDPMQLVHGHPDPMHLHHMAQQMAQQEQQLLQQQQGRQEARIEHGRQEPPGSGQPTRTERIQQLRAQHQRRHVERRGQYPLDEREERYEQRLEQPHHGPATQQQQGAPQPPDVVHHHRTPNYDLYGEMARPGSRTAITDPNRYSHYVNYEEIQHHLSKRTEQLSEQQIIQMRQQVQQQRGKVEEESRRQQHYHSQRRDPREVTQQRPVSNYYEYESVQTVIRAGQTPIMPPPHHPPHQQKQHFVRDSNANSLPRRGHERGEIQVHKSPGNYGNTPPPRQFAAPVNIINNNHINSSKQGINYNRGPPHIHDSYVPVHSRSSSRSNGVVFPSQLSTQQPGSKV